MDSNLFEICGWSGSLLLAFCGLPQAVQSWRTGSSAGVNWGLIWMWGVGEVLAMIYILPRMDLPLLFNYAANIVFLSVIAYYKVWPRVIP